MSARTTCKLYVTSTAWALMAGMSQAAGAQNLISAGAEAPADIIVTARRRDESLSKVPIAISAIGADAIIKQSIRTESDLQVAVPGLIVRQTGSSNAINYSIRGQSIDAYSNSAPGVLPYINDVQINTLGSSIFYDLDNVQVLKGPQGTLFGRNSTGGAVLFKLKEPTENFEGSLTGRYGNYDSRQLNGAINVPISSIASLRLAGSVQAGGAFVRNIVDNEKLGNLTSRSIRGILKLNLGDGLMTVTTAQYTKNRGRSTPTEIYSYNRCGSSNNGVVLTSSADCLYNPANPLFQAFLAANPGTIAGGVAGVAELQRQLGPWRAIVDGPIRHDYRGFFAINRTELDLSRSLTIKNIIGFNRGKKSDAYDFDGTPYLVFHNQDVKDAQLNNTHQFSEEFQIQGKAFHNRLNYVLGFYYLNQRDIVLSYDSAFGMSPIFLPIEFLYAFKTKDESLAGFAQATYRVTDQLNLTGGFRYTRDKLSAFNLPGSIFGTSSQSRSESKPSWTASIDYQVTPSLMVYATTRGSWRTGGYNYTSLPINVSSALGGNEFDPETTKDIEIGAKFNGRIGGMQTTLNTAAFSQWIDNIQRAAFVLVLGNPALVTNSVPQARVQGFESSLTMRPASWLNFGGSATYAVGKFTKPNTLALGVPLRFGPYADLPKFSGSIYAEASGELPGDTGMISLRGDVYAQTNSFFSNLGDTLTPNTNIPGYTLVNSRITWSSMFGTQISTALYVQNLFNKKYYAGGLPASSGFGINSVSPGRPRMFGCELRVAF